MSCKTIFVRAIAIAALAAEITAVLLLYHTAANLTLPHNAIALYFYVAVFLCLIIYLAEPKCLLIGTMSIQ
jgi:hypothetical protein